MYVCLFQCSVEGCSYSAAPKLVRLHYQWVRYKYVTLCYRLVSFNTLYVLTKFIGKKTI